MPQLFYVCCFFLTLNLQQVFATELNETEQKVDDPKLAVHQVIPSETDPAINTFTGNGFRHWTYYNASVPQKNELVVFLPGTGGKGKGSVEFNKVAANDGFHMIALAYPSDVSISHFKHLDDPDAFAKARENIISGKVQFGNLGVNEANSIDNRLLKLLQYLSIHFPTEHWEQYLMNNKSIYWEKIILTGQSQGGGHALFMAMKNKAARVIMFGSPKDFDARRKRPAQWYSNLSATPLNRFFSFVHSADEGHGCTYQQQLQNYRALQLMPMYKVIDVDHNSAPYGHSRLLTSTIHRDAPHVSVIDNVDYQGVWKYLLNEPVK
ncbi:MAG: hypothetical protein HQM09_18415 [Candidatus Riflebacteria bacterium]|nr:hypothetical protein [Candidatus Riflebacteria bacterium]